MKTIDYNNYARHYPDSEGYFGKYGGKYLPGDLQEAFLEAEAAYQTISKTEKFISELAKIQKEFQGRPTPLYHCARLSDLLGNRLQIYLKREDLNHTGAHKLNHCMGEGLLAKYMGKKRLIAETGAGQHGVAVATAAAYFGLDCEIHMGEIDIVKQAPNVAKMKILGAKVIPVTFGGKTLKEAVDSAFESYLKNHHDSLYCIGSAVGPHPFPMMVRDFQAVIGREAREQFIERLGRLPDTITACVGGGSNSIGLFFSFLADPVKIVGIEPLGSGPKKGEHAATLTYGRPGILHGFKSIVLQDDSDLAAPVHSIASGLDYPSVGPEHAFLKEVGRVEYDTVNDQAALEAFFFLSRTEGIIPALESAHALAYAIRRARNSNHHETILVNLSGRGDKDVDYIIEKYGTEYKIKR